MEYGNIVAVLTSCVRRSPWKCRPHSDFPPEFTFKVALLIATISRLYNFGSIGSACQLNCLYRLLVAWHKGTQQFVFGMILTPVKKRPLAHFVRLVYRPLRPLDHVSIPQCNARLVCFGIWRHRASGLLIYNNDGLSLLTFWLVVFHCFGSMIYRRYDHSCRWSEKSVAINRDRTYRHRRFTQPNSRAGDSVSAIDLGVFRLKENC